MNLLTDILDYGIKEQLASEEFTKSIEKILELKCYKSLNQIKEIIENESLTDFDCIEEIVIILESIGSNGGNRHDF